MSIVIELAYPCRKPSNLASAEAPPRIIPSMSDDLSPGLLEPIPKPHFDKLSELCRNEKLPEHDQAHVESAITRYHDWIAEMDGFTTSGSKRVEELVASLNRYKRSIELELIWDSEADFLFRQRGQLKLDNSIIEEFLPRLVDPRIVPSLEGKSYVTGPRRTFAGAYFVTSLQAGVLTPGLSIRGKDQDFTVGRPAFLRASFDRSSSAADQVKIVYLAYVAAECKTNLDKTMFQEAVATAHDLKVAMPGSRYYLVCEWLDMTPIGTGATDIDEVLVLRGKRINSNIRKRFSSSTARRSERSWFEDFLNEHPIRPDVIQRFVDHLTATFDVEEPQEGNVVKRGYF
jgi:hypothetical protein